MLRVIEKPSEEHPDLRTTLDELLRQGALRMLQEALEAEVEEYVTRHRAERDEGGRAQVVRNGKAFGAATRHGQRHAGSPRPSGQ